MKPILFNTEMVRAILDGRKTVTRRVAFPGRDLRPFPMKDSPDGWWFCGRAYRSWDDAMKSPQGVMSLCRYRPGDILYVRETWSEYDGVYIYKTHCRNKKVLEEVGNVKILWCPSIHMPKEASRLFLRVTDVKVERLQDISEEQAEKEGLERQYVDADVNVILWARSQFQDLWDSTIKKADLYKYGWDANPWVWVIEFERISKEEC